MILQERISVLVKVGEFIQSNAPEWQNVKEKAYRANQWFIPAFIDRSCTNIVNSYLQKEKLEAWAASYDLPEENRSPKKVGLVMAGNIPLVGFYDMLCIFLSGHYQVIKPSSKDDVLIKFLAEKMYAFNPAVKEHITFAERLNGCEAYIATGSNNTGRYFEYYFGRYPHIIRKNRTSVAIIEGDETRQDLENLSDDIQLYFGLGCRNVSKVYVPANYNFGPLLKALEKYDYLSDIHKYKHNYDYQLALLMMGSKPYMTNGSVLLSENKALFSAVSHVHYEYCTKEAHIAEQLMQNDEVQCIVGRNFTPFGKAQQPGLTDYADGVDTMAFLKGL